MIKNFKKSQFFLIEIFKTEIASNSIFKTFQMGSTTGKIITVES